MNTNTNTGITTKNFNAKLSGLINSAKTQRDNLQALIVFGLLQYRDHGNTTFLSIALNKCIGVKSLPTTTIKDYIKEHANLRWTQLKDKSHGFKKDGSVVEVKEIQVTWYDWDGGKHNRVTADMDVVAQAKALMNRIEKALKDHRVKDETQAKVLREGLAVLTA